MASLHQISKFYRSFSGTDTLAFILLPGSKPVVLGALTTISYSMFRNKKPVINIGRTNINGVTRGSRIFAGTMIFTLINQHWLREVQNEITWIKNFKELKVDELPLFDIMIVSANEYGSAVSMFIYGIDFTDEAQTISVEDLFTENTFSFVARDISTFESHNTLDQVIGGSSGSIVDNTTFQRYYIMHSDTDWQNVAEEERLYQAARVSFYSETGNRRYENDWHRELYYSPSLSRLMMGSDVSLVQTLLSQTTKYKISDDTFGTFTDKTADAVRAYQATNGLDVTGRVDQRTYISLVSHTNDTKERLYAMCTNKNGAIIYPNPDRSYVSSGLGTVSYGESVQYIRTVIGDDGEMYYQLEEGYVLANDMYSTETNHNTVEYPVLKPGDYGNNVAMLQSLLQSAYDDFVNFTSGYYDQKTKDFVMKFKKENGLSDDNYDITYEIWAALRAGNNDIFREASDDGFYIEVSKDPGKYEVGKNNLTDLLDDFTIKMYSDSSVTVKISAVMLYEDGTSKTESRTVTVKELTGFNFKTFKDCFMYNPELGDPTVVDFIVYPYNKQAYKWQIDYLHNIVKEGQ